MVFKTCAYTTWRNGFWKVKVKKYFPNLEAANHDDILCLIQYIEQAPQKFYSKKTFREFHEFLNTLKNGRPEFLKEIFSTKKREIDLALKMLNDINELKIHDVILATKEPEVFMTISDIINPNYLRLVEGVYGELIYPIALERLRTANKNEDCLKDINGRVQQLEFTAFNYLADYHNSTMRNGIAHGDVSFHDREIQYRDNKGNIQSVLYRDAIRIFDRLLDQCNGIALAIKAFVISNLDYFISNGIPVPRQLILEELKYSLSFEDWQVQDAIESTFGVGKSQINIFISNGFLDPQKVLYYSLRTVERVERFLPGFLRYYFHLNSIYSVTSWVAFDGPAIQAARLKRDADMGDFIKGLENNSIFFFPKIKLPSLLHRIAAKVDIFRTHWKIMVENFYPRKSLSIVAKMHRNGFYSVVNGDANWRNDEFVDGPTLVRRDYRKIVRSAIRTAKSQLPWYSPLRFLPLGFLSIGVYTTPIRIREFKTGLIPQFVGEIKIHKLARIRDRDIDDGMVEIYGKYKIILSGHYDGAV